MDQRKIGNFIAQRRKAEGLTQMELAEQLSVSNRTVSKWETGNGMPDIGNMQSLCEILKISVNDLLSGEVVSDTSYQKKAEENMLHLIKETKEAGKKRFFLRGIFGVFLILFFVVGSCGGIPTSYINWYLDFPTLIIILGGTFLMLTVSGLFFPFFDAVKYGVKKEALSDGQNVEKMFAAVSYAGKVSMILGVISFVVGMIMIMLNSDDPFTLRPSIAVDLLSLLYSFVFRVILLPLESGLRRLL